MPLKHEKPKHKTSSICQRCTLATQTDFLWGNLWDRHQEWRHEDMKVWKSQSWRESSSHTWPTHRINCCPNSQFLKEPLVSEHSTQQRRRVMCCLRLLDETSQRHSFLDLVSRMSGWVEVHLGLKEKMESPCRREHRVVKQLCGVRRSAQGNSKTDWHYMKEGTGRKGNPVSK